MSIIFSCKNCVPPERHLGCHVTCEKYIVEKEKSDKVREENHKKREHQRMLNSLNSNGTFYGGKRKHRKEF